MMCRCAVIDLKFEECLFENEDTSLITCQLEWQFLKI